MTGCKIHQTKLTLHACILESGFSFFKHPVQSLSIRPRAEVQRGWTSR
jgi:hypothetical protein